MVKSILQDVDSHVATGSQGDDITIVTMEVGARRARRRTDTIPGIQPESGHSGVDRPALEDGSGPGEPAD